MPMAAGATFRPVRLVLTLLFTGILLPAVPVIALEANAHRAGSAAALLGALQFGVGAAIAPVTGLFAEGSAVAMAGVMFGATVVTVAITFAITPMLRRSAGATAPIDAADIDMAEELMISERVV